MPHTFLMHKQATGCARLAAPACQPHVQPLPPTLLLAASLQGDTSPQADPSLYVEAVASLYRWYCSPSCTATAAEAVQQLLKAAEAAGAGPGSAVPTTAAAGGGPSGPGSAAGKQDKKGKKRGGAGKDKDKEGGSGSATASQQQARAAGPGTSLSAAAGGWPPLVVNLHGWVTGLGYDLTVDLLRAIQPSHVIQVKGGDAACLHAQVLAACLHPSCFRLLPAGTTHAYHPASGGL